MFQHHDDDGYVIFEHSDEEEECSSDDDVLADLFPAHMKRKDVDAQEFENEMNNELDAAVRKRFKGANFTVPGNGKSAKSDETKYYEDVYFDSSSDEDDQNNRANKTKGRKRHPIPSNDDLFYDPDMDNDDQAWVDRMRQKYLPKQSSSSENCSNSEHRKKNPLPESAAVLNCPACLSTLCRDCQRHDIYRNQFRAMFVMNCKVDKTQLLKFPLSSVQRRSKKNRNKRNLDTIIETETHEALENAVEVPNVASKDDDVYHPVHCTICNTQVAMYDKEEVYHFFSVVESFG